MPLDLTEATPAQLHHYNRVMAVIDRLAGFPPVRPAVTAEEYAVQQAELDDILAALK